MRTTVAVKGMFLLLTVSGVSEQRSDEHARTPPDAQGQETGKNKKGLRIRHK